MIHYCFICKTEIPNEMAEVQNRFQPPGNFLTCEKHAQEVDVCNQRLRNLRQWRNAGFLQRNSRGA